MSDLGYGTETAAPAVTSGSDAGDHSWRGEDSPAVIYGGDSDAFAAEDQLPARQDARTATWDDDLGYDEAGPPGEYGDELESLVGGDQLPSRQDSRAATWGDDPEYVSDADLSSEYDGDLDALMADGRLPPRQASGTTSWDDDPEYDEAALAAEYDGDLDALTADGHATATGSSPAGAPADTGSADDAGTGEPPHEAAQAEQPDALTRWTAQPDDSPASPDNVPEASSQDLQAKYEASLKDLEARYEARMRGLENEVQALKDRPQAAPDRPEDTGGEAGQPYRSGLPADQKNRKEPEHQDDRPGWRSNAKSVLYGAAGSSIATAGVSEFILKSPSGAVEALVTAVPAIAGLLVPTLREGWRRRHDNAQAKSRY